MDTSREIPSFYLCVYFLCLFSMVKIELNILNGYLTTFAKLRPGLTMDILRAVIMCFLPNYMAYISGYGLDVDMIGELFN